MIYIYIQSLDSTTWLGMEEPYKYSIFPNNNPNQKRNNTQQNIIPPEVNTINKTR